MFEVGNDVFKHGFIENSGDRLAQRRLRWIYGLFIFFFVLFAVRTLYLGIQGTDRSRLAGAD